MKILVTGGAGFIGSAVTDAYIAAGHKVWVVDDLSTGEKRNLNPKAIFKKINIQNAPAMKTLFHQVRFGLVNHHAAQIDVRDSVRNPQHDADINVKGLLNVLQCCVETNVKKIIFSASGGTAYGECTRPAKEGAVEKPLSPYGVTKLAGEKYIQAFSSLHGLSYTIFRYANVYGPRQNPHGEAGVVAIFSERLLKGQPVIVFGGGRQTRDFVFVKDVARANVLALRHGSNHIINIGTGRETSVGTLFNIMTNHVGLDIKPVMKPLRVGELRRSVLNVGKAQRVLHWKPAYSVSAGVAETLTYFRNKWNI